MPREGGTLSVQPLACLDVTFNPRCLIVLVVVSFSLQLRLPQGTLLFTEL